MKVVSLSLCALLVLPYGAYGKQNVQDTQKKAQPKKIDKKNEPKSSPFVPLSNIVQAVEFVVNTYQSRPEVLRGDLPKLKTADFDFKTVVDVKGGPSVNFLIFKLGYTHEKQTTNDVTFEYVPKSLAPPGAEFVPANLQDELTKAIEQAANQIKGEAQNDTNPIPLKFQSFAITIAFQVSNDYQGGVSIPIHLVTLGGSAERNSAATQSVKITFAFPEPKKP